MTLAFTEMRISLEHIREREGNRPPRKVAELAESIQAQGLLNRILVRQVGGVKPYELIGGHRRVAAHRELGLLSIDARVYDANQLDHEQAQELAEIDNLQREDLTPIEEGEAYLRLSEIVPTRAELAKRVGRSERHIGARIMLAELHPEIRAMVDAEYLDLGAAEVIAQTRRTVQDKIAPALAEEIQRRVDSGKAHRISRQVVQDILRDFTHALEDAPFDITDPDLAHGQPACGSCSKRTGVQGVLVEVIDESDVCIDPVCWDVKIQANRARVVADAKKRGLKVLSPAEEKKIMGATGPAWDAPFKSRAGTVYDGSSGSVPVASLVGPEEAKAIGFDEDGRAHELVPVDIVTAALKAAAAAAPKKKAPAATTGDDEDEDDSEASKDRAKAADQRKALQTQLLRSRSIAMAEIATQIEAGRISIETALIACIMSAPEELCEVMRAASPHAKRGKGTHQQDILDTAEQLVGNARTRYLAAMAAGLAVIEQVAVSGYSTGDQKATPQLALLEVDLAACRRQALTELRKEAKAKAGKPTRGVTGLEDAKEAKGKKR